MQIEKEMADRAAEIEERIRPFMPGVQGLQQTVIDAMDYSVYAGGKRLRPMLMEAAFQMFGGTGDTVMPFMAAIEMIHTYSLVHDDLPAMDNDEYRRGKKTTHAVYGEAMAILTGDALLNYAYETVAAAMTAHPGNERMGRAFAMESSGTASAFSNLFLRSLRVSFVCASSCRSVRRGDMMAHAWSSRPAASM